jgi:MFS family permease
METQNWSASKKLLVTLQVSWLAFLGPMSAAVANPAFVPIGKYFHISTVQASYSLMMYILWAAFGPLLAVPLANKYGRRPVYLVSNLIAGVCNIAGGYSSSWGGVLGTRAIVGIFAGSPPAIGAATICDLYFMHERGFYMGIFTFFLTNGPHTASLIGGFVAQYIGWRWCYTIPVSRASQHQYMPLLKYCCRVTFSLGLSSSSPSHCQRHSTRAIPQTTSPGRSWTCYSSVLSFPSVSCD